MRATLPTQNPQKILDSFMIHTDGILTHRENSVIRRSKKQLAQYLDQKRTQFYISFDLQGTHFQKKVWKALMRIPFGQTKCYQEIATQIQSPNAARAVGHANHENPLPIFIPCHRVISKSGSLGGFADGSSACLHLKEKLLTHEKDTLNHLMTLAPESTQLIPTVTSTH